MQETIKKVNEAEKKSAEILAKAGSRAADIINKKNSEISEKLNVFRSAELDRFNEAVKEAELKKQRAVDEVRSSEVSPHDDIESIADTVLQRVMTTIFDQP